MHFESFSPISFQLHVKSGQLTCIVICYSFSIDMFEGLPKKGWEAYLIT
jgi:hypothetical protein